MLTLSTFKKPAMRGTARRCSPAPFDWLSGDDTIASVSGMSVSSAAEPCRLIAGANVATLPRVTRFGCSPDEEQDNLEQHSLTADLILVGVMHDVYLLAVCRRTLMWVKHSTVATIHILLCKVQSLLTAVLTPSINITWQSGTTPVDVCLSTTVVTNNILSWSARRTDIIGLGLHALRKNAASLTDCLRLRTLRQSGTTEPPDFRS